MRLPGGYCYSHLHYVWVCVHALPTHMCTTHTHTQADTHIGSVDPHGFGGRAVPGAQSKTGDLCSVSGRHGFAG